eukprot:bmy_09147T0
MEELDQRAQTLTGPKAPMQLGLVQERLRERLRALQELAATWEGPLGRNLDPQLLAPHLFPTSTPSPALFWPSYVYFSLNPEPQAWAETMNNLLLQLSPGGWAANFWGTTGYPHGERELEGTLKMHEFMREAEDLQGRPASQKQAVRGGESLGEDYQDALLGATLSPTPLSPQRFCTKFVKFQHQVEMGGQRVATRQQLAESLLECGHSAAPQGPSDAAGSALQELLETGGTVQKLGPQAVQQRQRALVQAWETLKLHVEQHRVQLEWAWLLARFHAACACTNETLQLWREDEWGHEEEEHWACAGVRLARQRAERGGRSGDSLGLGQHQPRCGTAPPGRLCVTGAAGGGDLPGARQWPAEAQRPPTASGSAGGPGGAAPAGCPGGQQALLAAGTSIKEAGPPFLVPSEPTPTEPVPTPLRHAGLSSEASLGTRFRLVHAALPSAGSPHAHAQVQEGLQVLQDKQEQVFQAWEQKQERLQARHRELLFLRKCGHLDETLTAREAGALTP